MRVTRNVTRNANNANSIGWRPGSKTSREYQSTMSTAYGRRRFKARRVVADHIGEVGRRVNHRNRCSDSRRLFVRTMIRNMIRG